MCRALLMHHYRLYCKTGDNTCKSCTWTIYRYSRLLVEMGMKKAEPFLTCLSVPGTSPEPVSFPGKTRLVYMVSV